MLQGKKIAPLFLLLMAFGLTACGSAIEHDAITAGSSAIKADDKVLHSRADSASPDLQIYWGDLHVHSLTSFDSFAFGNDNLSADDAFKFARGEAIAGRTGVEAKLARPLDFLLVSDHAEFMGILQGLKLENTLLLNSSLGKRWNEFVKAGDIASIVADFQAYIAGSKPNDDYMPDAFVSDVWNDSISAAERHNQPGTFTAFVGFEWTSMINGANLHRNVLFRDGLEKAKQITPYSALDSNDPEDLWAFLAEYETKTQGHVMAIPHNSNLSAGMMFAEKDLSGQALDLDYAERRARWEPIVEITQMKGDSETHPLISPLDSFADFENWDATDIQMNVIKDEDKLSVYTHSYARPALKLGLEIDSKVGANPYQFGVIGSTDSHTAFATADDNNFFGKFPDSEPAPERLNNKMGGAMWNNRLLSASGYVAVWAEENTRESLFDALKQRRVYASTGPRIKVQFFGGWGLDSDNANGVPMGGELTVSQNQKAPSFQVKALKDPQGANLDRIQIIKGWLEKGESKEQVYDVALSGERQANSEGKVKALGSTVNTRTASYTNSIGAAQLSALWSDPNFDSSQRAFYYARVIEIPTPRWSTYDAARFKLPIATDVPDQIQERAYTSPIWYQP